MADIPFIVPALYARKTTNRPEMVGGERGLHDGSNTFLRHNFVVLTSGYLAALASGAVLSCGLVLDESKDSDVVNPPTKFFGDRHFPVALEHQRFAVWVTDASGHVGLANGAPLLSEIVIGESYGIIKLSDGTHALNVDNTTNDFFTVVEVPAQYNGRAQALTDSNGVVIVEIVPAAIQLV